MACKGSWVQVPSGPQMEKKLIVVPVLYDSYLAVIRNSIGSNSFRNFYAKVDGVKTDIIKNGELSCAFFASSVLIMFQLIKEGLHMTVDGTVRDMKQSGWQTTEEPKIGSVLVWEALDFGRGGIHKHIGFYIGNNQAISTNYKIGQPVVHHWTFDNKRKIEMIFWHKKLDG